MKLADLSEESTTASESSIFYYHPDHLGSTAIVTDVDGRITQNVVYIPFGEVFVEQRDGNWITPYLFNAKELDEETGLYYYGARYLDPTAAQWLSVDPLWEEHAGISPFNYCMSNPVKLIDPDGRDEYEVNPEGYIRKVENSISNKNILYSVDENGIRNGPKISIKNKSVLDELTKKRLDFRGTDADNKNLKYGHYAYSKSSETLKLFVFLADVSSSAEWGLEKYDDGSFGVFTLHQNDAVKTYEGSKYKLTNVVYNIHSHPGFGKEGTMGGSGSGWGTGKFATGDCDFIFGCWNDWYYTYRHDIDKQRQFPCYFVYHRKSQTLYQYTPYVKSIDLGKVVNYNVSTNINKHKWSLYRK